MSPFLCFFEKTAQFLHILKCNFKTQKTMYTIAYKDENGNFVKWEDADVKTEFETYAEAINYINNASPCGVDLGII